MNPDVILPVLALIFGGSAGGGGLAIYKAVRGRKVEDVDLVTRIRGMANAEVVRAEDQLKAMRKDIDAMRAELTDERRRSQALESALRNAGIPIPPWPPEPPVPERPERRHQQRPIDFEDRRKDSHG